MKEPITPIDQQAPTPKTSTNEFVNTNVLSIALLAIFALGDIGFSIYNGLSASAGLVAVTLALQVFSKLLVNSNNQFLSPTTVFILTAAAILAMVIVDGFALGSFLYFFPALVIYLVSTIDTNDEKRYRNLKAISLTFAVAVVAGYFLLPNQKILLTTNYLPIFRFFAVVVLTVLLSKKLVAVKPAVQRASGLSAYSEAIFQNSLDGYLVFDQETKEVKDHNQRISGLFALPSEVDLKKLFMTQVLMRYLAEDSANKELLMDMIPDNWHGEATFINHRKEKFYSYIKSVVYQKEGNNYQVLSIRDISTIKASDEKLKEYKESVEKAGRAKARFLSSMSHELRTPLNGIIGTSNLIKIEADLPESIQKHVDVLLYSSEHMLGIINDILDFSKIDAGKLELNKQSFSIDKCTDNIIASFESQFKNKNIRLVFEKSPELKATHVLSDETKLSQVITNLLSNALKFTLVGSVTLSVKTTALTKNKISILFEISDTGIGIPKEKQKEIFQGFSQVHAAELSRRFGGTGLGLTISEKLVTIFGGELKVESELEKGSRFYFTIAFDTTAPAAPIFNIPVAEDNADIRGIKILVVEDNEINVTILKSFLKKWEVQVMEAGNGVHALEILKYHRFDLILMDLEMPEMDGYAAIKIIRQTDTATPILAFTASLLENMDNILSEAGFNGYVLKPFRPAALKAKIELYAPHRKILYA